MKVGAIADLHFGKNVDGNTNFNRSEETLIQLDKAVDYLQSERVDAIVVLGDIAHTNHPSIKSNIYIRKALKLLGDFGRPVLIFPGNHDYTHEGNHILQPFMSKDQSRIDIVDKPCLWNGMCVMPHMPRKLFADIKSKEDYDLQIKQMYKGVLKKYPSNILLTHAQIQGCVVNSDYMFESGVLEFPQLDNKQLKLVVAGDIHKAQMFDLGGVSVVYPGSLIQTDYGEKDDVKGVALFDTSTLENTLQEIPGYKKYYHLELNSLKDVDVIKKSIWGNILDIEIKDCGERDLIEQRVNELSALSIRDIRIQREEDNIKNEGFEIAGKPHEEQFLEYLNSLDFTEAQKDKLLFAAKNIMGEIRG